MVKMDVCVISMYSSHGLMFHLYHVCGHYDDLESDANVIQVSGIFLYFL